MTGFTLLGVLNSRCAVHGNNVCSFDPVETCTFIIPGWPFTLACVCLLLYSFIAFTHRTKPKVLIIVYKAPGYISSLISYYSPFSLASRLLFICIKQTWALALVLSPFGPWPSALCTSSGDSSSPCVSPPPADQPQFAYMVPQQVSKRENHIGLSRPRLDTGTGPHLPYSVGQSRSQGKSRFRG